MHNEDYDSSESTLPLFFIFYTTDAEYQKISFYSTKVDFSLLELSKIYKLDNYELVNVFELSKVPARGIVRQFSANKF